VHLNFKKGQNCTEGWRGKEWAFRNYSL